VFIFQILKTNDFQKKNYYKSNDINVTPKQDLHFPTVTTSNKAEAQMCVREALVHFTVRSEARRQILTKYIFNVNIFAECVTIWQLSQNFLVFWVDGDN
jgi:hypothetical protein